MVIKTLMLYCSLAVMQITLSETITRQKQDGYELAAEPYCRSIDNDSCEIYLVFSK